MNEWTISKAFMRQISESPIVWAKKLRHREGQWLPSVTWQANGGKTWLLPIVNHHGSHGDCRHPVTFHPPLPLSTYPFPDPEASFPFFPEPWSPHIVAFPSALTPLSSTSPLGAILNVIPQANFLWPLQASWFLIFCLPCAYHNHVCDHFIHGYLPHYTVNPMRNCLPIHIPPLLQCPAQSKASTSLV